MFGICRKSGQFGFVLILVIIFISGCVAKKTHELSILSPLSAEVSNYKKITVTPTKEDGNVFTKTENAKLTSKIILKLRNNNLFFDIRRVSLKKPEWGDMRIEFKASSIKRVTPSERGIGGSLAGQAEVVLNVSLINQATGDIVGKAKIIGKSANGGIYAGGTDEAIDEGAEGIVKFLKNDMKKI